MWPKEHGAYGQLAFPLLTALAIAGASTPALLLTLALVALFIAHEPLLGRRGARIRREQGRRAATWLACATATGAAAGVAGFQTAPETARLALVIPLVSALVLGGAIAAGREKTTLGELPAALAFSSAAVPVAQAAGASMRVAGAVAAAFALVYATQTLAVRSVILAVRGGGDPIASHAARRTAPAVGVTGLIAIAGAAARDLVPWATAVAVLPGLVAVGWIVLAPPPPTRLRRVGWTLVGASVATAAILVAAV
jgi:hypothetical protein